MAPDERQDKRFRNIKITSADGTLLWKGNPRIVDDAADAEAEDDPPAGAASEPMPKGYVPPPGARRVDLLSLVDVNKDAVFGKWTRIGDAVESPKLLNARLEIPLFAACRVRHACGSCGKHEFRPHALFARPEEGNLLCWQAMQKTPYAASQCMTASRRKTTQQRRNARPGGSSTAAVTNWSSKSGAPEQLFCWMARSLARLLALIQRLNLRDNFRLRKLR